MHALAKLQKRSADSFAVPKHETVAEQARQKKKRRNKFHLAEEVLTPDLSPRMSPFSLQSKLT